MTGDPGVGKTGLLDAAADIASAGGSRILRAAGIQFEAEMSYAGLNQVLLPLLGELPQALPSTETPSTSRLALARATRLADCSCRMRPSCSCCRQA